MAFGCGLGHGHLGRLSAYVGWYHFMRVNCFRRATPRVNATLSLPFTLRSPASPRLRILYCLICSSARLCFASPPASGVSTLRQILLYVVLTEQNGKCVMFSNR